SFVLACECNVPLWIDSRTNNLLFLHWYIPVYTRAVMPTPTKLTQSEAVCQLIRSEILEGQLLPGTKLNIKALEQRFEVSLGAIREALSRLSAEGMVIAEAHRGYRVSPVSSEELLDLTQTRVELESLCLAKAMKHGDLEWELRIAAAAHRMERLQAIPSEEEARKTQAWNQAHG